MARLILVRHARTAETGIKLSGRIKGIPLSPAGRKEAAALAEVGGKNRSIDLSYPPLFPHFD